MTTHMVCFTLWLFSLLSPGRQSLAAFLSRGSLLRKGAREPAPAGVPTPVTVHEESEPSPLLLAKVALHHGPSSLYCH